jgi:hypothetical protein
MKARLALVPILFNLFACASAPPAEQLDFQENSLRALQPGEDLGSIGDGDVKTVSYVAPPFYRGFTARCANRGDTLRFTITSARRAVAFVSSPPTTSQSGAGLNITTDQVCPAAGQTYQIVVRDSDLQPSTIQVGLRVIAVPPPPPPPPPPPNTFPAAWLNRDIDVALSCKHSFADGKPPVFGPAIITLHAKDPWPGSQLSESDPRYVPIVGCDDGGLTKDMCWAAGWHTGHNRTGSIYAGKLSFRTTKQRTGNVDSTALDWKSDGTVTLYVENHDFGGAARSQWSNCTGVVP